MKRYWILAIGCWLVAAGMQADEVMKIDASKVQQITFTGDAVTVKYNDGTADTTMDMGTVVIDFSNTTGIREYGKTRRWGDEKTGRREDAKAVYDLQGRKRTQGAQKKGIYMIDGKKVVTK